VNGLVGILADQRSLLRYAQTGMDVLCVEMPIHQHASHVNRAKEHIAQLKERFKT
jgi:hypothetical protein